MLVKVDVRVLVMVGVKVGVIVEVLLAVGVGVSVITGSISMGMFRSSRSRLIHPSSKSCKDSSL